MDKLAILIRPVTKEDIEFILSSATKSMQNQKVFAKLDRGWVAASQHALITRLLSESTTLVAVNPDYLDQVYGYILGAPEKNVLHWVYVKYDFRNAGVGGHLLDTLLPDEPRICSIQTSALKHLLVKWQLVFDGKQLTQRD